MTMKIQTFFFVLVLFCTSFLAVADDVTIYGTVRSKEDRSSSAKQLSQQFVPDAKVMLFFNNITGKNFNNIAGNKPLETKTNEIGEFDFTFSSENVKSITILAVAPDRKFMGRFPMNEEQYRTKRRNNIYLNRDFFSVTGIVKDSQGNPVADAFICHNPRGSQNDYTYTDTNGRFELLTPQEDNLNTIYAVKPGAGITFDNKFLHKNKSRDEQYQHFSQPIELILKKPQHLILNIVNKEGQPVAGCKIVPVLFWNSTNGGTLIPLTYTTNEKGTAEIDWIPTEPFTDSNGNEVWNGTLSPFCLFVRPPQENEQEESLRYTTCHIDVRTLNGAVDILEKQFVLPYKSVVTVKIANPFENETTLPAITVFYNQNYWAPVKKLTNNSEFTLQSVQGTVYTIQCEPNLADLVFPTIYESKFKNETEKDELAVTLQRGTLVRVKLTDEVDGTAQWIWSVGDGITLRLANIQYNDSIPLNGLYHVILERTKKAKDEKQKLTELQFYLPPGKYELSAKKAKVLSTKRVSTFREEHILAPPMDIVWDENPKQFTVTNEKEIEIEFKILEKNKP
jgi:hypothetical protein